MSILKRRFARFGSGVAVAALLGSALVMPAVAADINASVTVQAGDLTLTAGGDLAFDPATRGEAYTDDASTTFTVTNWTNDAGWTLSASATEFTNGDDEVLAGAELTVTGGSVAGPGDPVDPVGPTANLIGSAGETLYSYTGAEFGTFTVDATFELDVDQVVGSAEEYTSTVTVTVASDIGG